MSQHHYQDEGQKAEALRPRSTSGSEIEVRSRSVWILAGVGEVKGYFRGGDGMSRLCNCVYLRSLHGVPRAPFFTYLSRHAKRRCQRSSGLPRRVNPCVSKPYSGATPNEERSNDRKELHLYRGGRRAGLAFADNYVTSVTEISVPRHVSLPLMHRFTHCFILSSSHPTAPAPAAIFPFTGCSYS